MAFGALLFIYITKRINILPFNDIDSLLTDTSYNIVTLKGSIGDIAFKVLINTFNIICFVYIRFLIYNLLTLKLHQVYVFDYLKNLHR